MDDEDMGEFGIAPQKIQPKDDFATGPGPNKRKFERPSEGPIPGEPVLQNIMKPVHDKAAVRILKSMGWRDHQGIGSRQTFREKKKMKERNLREMYVQKRYGCDVGPMQADQDDDEDDISDEEITFAPDDFDPYIANIKENRFGLGYSGLQPSSSAAQHVNLFRSFEVVDRNNKKLSIRGQAFGVGALEEEDDDIYQPDDMSRYDKSLGDAVKSKEKPKAVKAAMSSFIEGFSKATIADSSVKVFSVEISR
jgi:G patch domain-containing protein 1